MANLVLLLSLLSVIIGWSEAWFKSSWPERKKDVCGFLLDRGVTQPLHELKTEKKNEEPGKVLLEFKEAVQPSDETVLRIRLFCDDETDRKIAKHGYTVEFDLYLSDDYTYARVKYLDDLKQQTKYIITQSGENGPVAYDVSGLYQTFIIPSSLLTGESEKKSAEQLGYWLRESEEVHMLFYGGRWKILDYGSLVEHKYFVRANVRFEFAKAGRTHTTVAFGYRDGMMRAFPVPLIDATTTDITCEKMVAGWWAIVLSRPGPLDGRIFFNRQSDFQSGDNPNFHLYEDKDKVTYGSPLSPTPAVTSARGQNSGKKRASSPKKRVSFA